MKFNTVDSSAASEFQDASLQQQQQHFEHIKSIHWSHADKEDDTHADDKTHIITHKATRNFIPRHYNNTMLEHYRACLSTIELRSQCMCPT